MKNSKVVDCAKLAFDKVCLTGVGLGILALILAHMAIYGTPENKKKLLINSGNLLYDIHTYN